MQLKSPDLEVKLREERNRTVIEGKTSVPFKTFVALILQRKIIPLFKDWGDEPVIVNSELLTSIASASQDSQENRTQVVIVTLGVGVLTGVFAFAIAQSLLMVTGITLGQKELLIIAGGLVGLSLLASALSKVQRGNRAQKVTDKMEKVASLLSK
ncbi:hypothetical protein KKF55_00590 [Patescibacteria group bacterium]|nr:hypothetical protein [Patescibacteria group bacterium]